MNNKEFLADVFVFTVLAILAKSVAYFRTDLYITRSLQLINLGWFDSLMKLLSFIGDPIRFMPAVLAVGLLVSLYFHRNYLVLIYGSFFGAVALGVILKMLIARVRPDPVLIHQYLPQLARDSFPSGHVLEYIGLFGAILIIVNKEICSHLARKVIQVILLSLIFLIGVSRIYLGEHWFSDVLGSYLLGIAWIYLCTRIYNNQRQA